MTTVDSLYAVDPGTTHSALVITGNFAPHGLILPNADLLRELCDNRDITPCHLVIEQIESFGMAVGKEVFETVFWAGRFAQAWDAHDSRFTWSMLPRKAVKLALCGTVKAKDANIRQALIDRYGGPSCIKKGGPLAGIKSHLWAALALAVTYQEQAK